MKRLLCILSSMDAGGAETFLMKIYRKIDRTQYQMDFCINVFYSCFYEAEINSLGGKIYRIPAKSANLREFKRQLGEIISKGKYQNVLRITSNAMGFMDLKIAKENGALLCCARSSNSSDGGGLKSFLAHYIGRLLYSKYVDVKIAPSDLAAKYTFGYRSYKSNKVKIIRNGLDINYYSFNAQARMSVREEFGIPEDSLVFGHVGRFDYQKNHEYLIKVFTEIKKKNSSAVLMLVGAGPRMKNIKNRVDDSKLTEVYFTGLRSDIPSLLSAMDVFVFPSLYEGMPNTVIEAQAVGLPCIISNTITKEANITGNVVYMGLDEAAEKWADKALCMKLDKRECVKKCFISSRYDIESVEEEFTDIVFNYSSV